MLLTRLAYSLTTSALRRAMSTKPILLYSAGTPNGTVGTILLEELKAAYGDSKIDYESVLSPSYLHLCQLRSN